MRLRPPRWCLLLWLGLAGATACGPAPAAAPAVPAGTVGAAEEPSIRTLRVTGLVEAAHASTVSAPRLRGPGSGVLVVTRLVRGGTVVHAGDPIVAFDPAAQEKVAFDRRAEYQDFVAQLARKEAEHAGARAKDEADLETAERAVARARLEMLKNEMLAAILVEKNEQTLAEAEAHLEMLRGVFELKRRAEHAERRALEIQRDRARTAMRHAEGNIDDMTVRAPQDGLVVIKTVWRGGQMGEVQEGEEVRPGTPLLDVVDPGRMRIRARVNQADVLLLRPGQRVSIELDAYPGKRFTGTLARIAPTGTQSAFSPRVRTFTTLFTVDQHDSTLLPDLTAAVDVEIDRRDARLWSRSSHPGREQRQ